MLITMETKKVLNPTVDLQQALSLHQYTTAKWEIAEAANRTRKREWGNTEINIKPDNLISEVIFTVVNY